jgi:hypothetical protein
VTLVVLLVIAWSASFYFYASNRLDYLTGRALRELTALGTRTDNALNSAHGILQLRRRDASKIFGSADLSPVYRHLNVWLDTKPTRTPEAIKAQATFRPGWFGRHCAPDSTFDAHPGFHRDSQSQLPSSCLQASFSFWLTRPKDSVEVQGKAALNVATLLDAGFRYPIDARVFDLVVLADRTGHILLQTGPMPLRLGRLDALPAQTEQSGKSAREEGGNWETLRFRPTIMDVEMAGSTFRLFQAPCCLSSTGTWNDRPFIVAGLVRKSSFLLQGLRLPLSVMTVLSAVLVIALLAWPFLKFGLIGERQRIRPSDGLKLGASSLLGAALLTVFALAFYGYHKFRDQRDRELAQFAGSLSSRFTGEIVRAYDQLTSLVEWAGTTLSENRGFPRLQDSLKLRFPLFESFALIDSKGFQRSKWSTDSLVQPPVPVQHRRYFQDARNGTTWSLILSRTGPRSDTLRFALEPVRSLTTGRHEAVLAIRTGHNLPVAAMALDMVSVVGTVLPVGVGFAIIDDEGRVLFHADETRNLEENFFIETNQNRHLRSAVLARSPGHMTLTYAGGDYRAYVSPLSGVPWTLIAFRDMQPGRVVSAEWVLSSSSLIFGYLLILLALTGVVVLFVPGTRLATLWPDRRQRRAYGELIGILLSLAGGFLLVIVGLAGDPLLLASLLLPLLAIVLTVLRLQTRDDIRRMIQDRRPAVKVLLLSALLLTAGLAIIAMRSDASLVSRIGMVSLTVAALVLATIPAVGPIPRFQPGMVPAYRTAAGLFLLLIGALPAAGFFKVAHAVHAEALVKYQQVKLSDDLRRPGPARCRATSDPLCAPDAYLSALGLWGPADTSGADMSDTPASRRNRSTLAGHLLPPVRLESSVEWADMSNDTATDGSRAWTVKAGALRLLPAFGDSSMKVASVIPSLGLDDSHWWLLVVMTGLAGLVIWWIVGFVARHLFLLDMSHPVDVAARSRMVVSVDTNLLLLCRDCQEENRLQFAEHFAALDMSQPAWETEQEFRRIRQSAVEGRPVVLRHFEQHRRDPARAETSLRLVDRLLRDPAATVVLVESREPEGGPLGLGREWNAVLPGECSGGKAVLESFVLVDPEKWAGGESEQQDRRARSQPAGSTPARQLLAEEGRGDRNLTEIWKGLARAFELAGQEGNAPTRRELLDLLGEKAEAYYDQIWASCRSSERVVLGHLAQDGLVNAKDWRVLRRLLARGLVRRDPQFRVLNETFRRYLVRHAEAAETELGADFRSVWDNVKGPLVAVVATAIIVLLVTQQGLFNATTNVVMGLSSGIPAFAKVVEFIGGRKQAVAV